MPELPADIAAMLDPLDETERRVLVCRFGVDRGSPRTVEEVSEVLAAPVDEIRDIEIGAVAKLRPAT